MLVGVLPLINHFVSHAPYNKIVRKLFARLCYHDALREHQQRCTPSCLEGEEVRKEVYNELRQYHQQGTPDCEEDEEVGQRVAESSCVSTLSEEISHLAPAAADAPSQKAVAGALLDALEPQW